MTPRFDHVALRRNVATRVGIDVVIQESGDLLRLVPAEGDPRQTFQVTFAAGGARLEARVRLGSYAGELLEQMGRALPGERTIFSAVANAARRDGVGVLMRVNGTEVDPCTPADWPTSWRDLQLDLLRLRVPLIEMSQQQFSSELERLAELSLLLMLSLAAVPVGEEEEHSAPDAAGLPEGAVERIAVNRYERSRLNRSACIAIHGDSCLACKVRLGDRYGAAADGLIHVHHVTPVSLLGAEYIVDPARDLVPLCPNCHAVAHTSVPPLSVDDIRALLSGQPLGSAD